MIQTPQRADQIPAVGHAEAMRVLLAMQRMQTEAQELQHGT